MSTTFSDNGTTGDFYYNLILGNVPGAYQGSMFGLTPARDIADGILTIWDNDFDLTRITTPTEMFINSTDAGDVGINITVNGLDSNYQPQTLTADLNGQTQVSVGTFAHVQTASLTIGETEPAGDIYIASTGTLTAGVPDDNTTVKSKIVQGANITRNAFFMVPEGKAILITTNRASVDTVNKTVKIYVKITPDGATAPFESAIYTCSTGLNEFNFGNIPVGSQPLPSNVSIPIFGPRTFLEYKCEVDANATIVYFSADYIAVDSNQFSQATV